MEANYFFIDGSALMAQIRQLQRANPVYRDKKLCPREFIAHFMHELRELHGRSYKRATFYFPKGDESSVEQYLRMPEFRKPGQIRDIHFKFCGHKLKKSAEFDTFVEESVPAKFQSRFSKSEKGIDIEMCCDALKLASTGRLERLFLLTNDGDFIPLCRTLKDFGSNISIIHLSDSTLANTELLREADSYDIVSSEQLDAIFFAVPAEGEQEGKEVEDSTRPREDATRGDGEPESEKPDTEPSDLKIDDTEIPNGG